MKSKKLLLILAVFLFTASPIYAESVVLKNGRIMKGRITEKNDRYIVIQAGEGADAVRSTIFIEDINRIEKEGSSVPASVTPRPAYPKFDPVSAPSVLKNATLVSVPPPPEIKALVEGQKSFQTSGTDHLQAEDYKKLFQAGLVEPDDATKRYQKYINKLTQEKMSKEASRQIEVEEKPPASDAPVGTGSIRGNIVLPEEFEKHEGDLVVYVTREGEDGRFVLPWRPAYTRVSGKDILSFTVPYTIDNLSEGQYKVSAQWDTAKPLIREESVSGRTILGGLGTKGDYSGQCETVIALAQGEKKERIDFTCTKLLDRDQGSYQTLSRPDFEVSDIYFRRDSQGRRAFFLVIKNRSAKTISTLPLDIQINDESFLPGPFEARKIEPGEDKEFDITGVLSTYQNSRKKGARALDGEGPHSLKIKVLWSATQEIEFEKTLYVI